MMGPMILGLTVTQLNTLGDDIIALCFMNEQSYPLGYGALSYLYYAQRLYQFPLGVLGISLATAIFPVMSSASARKDFTDLARTVSRGLCACVFISIPAMVGLVAIAKPLIALAFQHGQFSSEDTDMVAWTLLFYALGLCGYFSQQVVTRAFYSMQDSKTPMASALTAVAANIVLNLVLIWFLGTGGLALSTALCSYLQVVVLVLALRRKFGSSILDGMLITLFKTIAATILMWMAGQYLLYLCRNLPDSTGYDILRLAIVVPIAAAVYTLAAKLLRIEMLSLFSGKKP